MTQKQAIQLFEERKVRTVWDDQTEEWYFSIVDVVGVLTDSVNPTDYIKKMKKRDPELSKGWGQIVTPLSVQTAGGRQRVNCATTQGMFRIIQSIPSPKAEPFKQWMAQVAADRLDQMQDPELSIQQAMVDYKRLGYSDNWINQRLKAIEVRKDLTDAWKKRGVQEGQQFATLTDIITNVWSGFTTREYKAYKGLRKENLRDNMTNTELILNMLAEASTKDITEATDPRTLAAHKAVARQGGTIARNARLELEASGRLLDGGAEGDHGQLAALTVERHQRLGLLVVSLQAIQNGSGLVVLADDGLAAAQVAHTLDLALLVDDVVACAALLADAAAAHALHDHAVLNLQFQHLVDADAHGLDGLGLSDGAGHAVQDEAVGAVVLCQAFLQDADDDLIGYQVAFVHIGLGLHSRRRALLDGRAQNVTGGNRGDS